MMILLHDCSIFAVHSLYSVFDITVAADNIAQTAYLLPFDGFQAHQLAHQPVRTFIQPFPSRYTKSHDSARTLLRRFNSTQLFLVLLVLLLLQLLNRRKQWLRFH